jgi:hypothetical protein
MKKMRSRHFVENIQKINISIIIMRRDADELAHEEANKLEEFKQRSGQTEKNLCIRKPRT